MSLESLMDAVRRASTPSVWSRGVELVRRGAVITQRMDASEVELRVAGKRGLSAPEVTLFPADDDWSCECPSRDAVCEHVAASVIALRQADREGESPPGTAGTATDHMHVAYRLDARGGPLTLQRVLVDGAGERPLEGSLAQFGGPRGPRLIASTTDLQFEARFPGFRGGVISRPAMNEVLEALSTAEDVRFEGRPIRIGAPTSGLCVRVREHDGGFLVRLQQDPSITQLFDNGALRQGDMIRPLGGHGLTEKRFLQLRKGKIFAPDEVGNLVGKLLPHLRRTLPVHTETDQLPGSSRVRPRLHITTQSVGETSLAVMGHVVYGNPPVARVDGSRLTLLAGGDVPLRRMKQEKALTERLRDEYGLEPGVRRILPATEALAFADIVRESIGDVVVSGKAHEDFHEVGMLTPRMEVVGDDLSVWFESSADDELSGGKRRVDARAVIQAWERGEEVTPVLAGGFGRLPMGWLQAHGDRVAGLLAAKEAAAGGKERALAAVSDVVALCESMEQPPPPSFERLRPLLADFSAIPPAPLPEDLTGELRDYQRLGVDWLAFLQQAGLGALLADDMGLGKTLQVLCVVEKPALVVAPTSVLHNWSQEIRRFRPSLRVAVFHGSDRSLDEDVDVVLTTYAILRLDIERLAARQWATVILDEAQNIKNAGSQVARAAYRLQGRFRVALSGTPVENRLDDLWSQFHFLNPGLLGGRREFNARIARAVATGDAAATERLRQRIRPFLLRRTKRDVARELPPRTDLVLHCELDPTERAVYDAVRAATQAEVVAKLRGGKGGVLEVLEALLRLRQAACHPALIPGQGALAARSSAKTTLLLESLDEVVAEGHKALVFSQWVSLLDLLEPHLRERGIRFNRLDGSTRDRAGVVQAFQQPDGPSVMIVSLKAGGVGLNLTAADNVFLLDPWWNPAVEDQAADRAHRIGQTQPVFVHRLVARDTVEERILGLQERKRALADIAVGQGVGSHEITRDELLSLFD